jgi:hypothetical protein
MQRWNAAWTYSASFCFPIPAISDNITAGLLDQWVDRHVTIGGIAIRGPSDSVPFTADAPFTHSAIGIVKWQARAGYLALGKARDSTNIFSPLVRYRTVTLGNRFRHYVFARFSAGIGKK